MPITTKDGLLLQHPAPEWRERFLQLLDIRQLLRDCILCEGYSLPDEFNSAIRLTTAGRDFLQTLVTKHQVNAKVARVRTFLTMNHSDLLVDVEKTEIDLLRKTINDQVLQRKILVPNQFGRELYDKASTEFEEEIPILTHAETMRLLRDTSIGFSQLGNYVTGPYGYLQSKQDRWLGPQTDLPLYHCSKITCDAVHLARLSTDPSTEINKTVDLVRQLTEPHHSSIQAWIDFERELTLSRDRSYDDSATTTLPILIAECLSDREIAHLLSYLLKNTSGELIKTLPPAAGRCTDPAKFASDRSRHEAYQLIMLRTDREIIQAIETLSAPSTETGTAPLIIIPDQEIRTPRVSKDVRSGHFDLQPELSNMGVRFKAGYGISHLRLHRLIDQMYPRSSEHEQEFEWQFRLSGATDRDAQQEEVLRLLTPREVIEKVVLSRSDNVTTAIATLGISEAVKSDDERLIDTILWKLGYPPDSSVDENADFWSEHSKMTAISQTAGATAHLDRTSIRGTAANFFTEVEHILDDSLAFTTWLLLYDHLKSPAPFIYRTRTDHKWAMETLESISVESAESSDEVVHFSDKNTLGPLIQGPRILAQHLKAITTTSEDFCRPLTDLPIARNGTDLKRYPFRHSVLFLDLTQESREALIETLTQVTKTLSAHDVAGVRNSWSHYRREEADIEGLRACLEATSSALLRLEAAGLSRVLYRPVAVQRDPGERTLTIFEASRERSISVAGPSRLDLSGLPPLHDSQYLISAAVLPRSRDIVRAGVQPESEYTKYWSGFPNRRAQPAQSAGPASSGVRSLSPQSTVVE